MKPFTDTLREYRKGEVADLCTEQLNDVVKKVLEHRKPGTFTLTITVTPDKMGGNEVELAADVATKLPRRKPRVATFFANHEGDLVRDDPDQRPLFADADDRRAGTA